MDMQEYFGKVTQKGQVTIPLAVRKLLRVKPYDRVIFRVTEGRVELLSAHLSVETAFGILPPRARPENWKAARHLARKKRAHRQIQF